MLLAFVGEILDPLLVCLLKTRPAAVCCLGREIETVSQRSGVPNALAWATPTSYSAARKTRPAAVCCLSIFCSCVSAYRIWMRCSSPFGLDTAVLWNFLMTSSQMSRDSKLLRISHNRDRGWPVHTEQSQRRDHCHLSHEGFSLSTLYEAQRLLRVPAYELTPGPIYKYDNHIHVHSYSWGCSTRKGWCCRRQQTS